MDDVPQNPSTCPPAESGVEAILRDAAFDAIRAGRMPSHQAGRIWGGAGSGQTCPVCQKKVDEQQFEIEMEFAPNGIQWRVLHLHVQCCSAWEWARRDFPGGRVPHGPIHDASVNGANLPDGSRPMIIGARERQSAGRPGPAR